MDVHLTLAKSLAAIRGLSSGVLVLALAATGCKQGEPVRQGQPPLQVSFSTVEQRDIPVYGDWVGNLDGFVNAQIQPQVSGYLVRQNYREGDRVHKGDVLFEIDPRPFEASLEQARGQLGQAQAQLELSRMNVQRDTPLVAIHALSKSQLDTDTQQTEQYEALVRTNNAAITTASLNLGWTKVRSQIDGIAGRASTQVGNLVNTSTMLTTVSQVNPIKSYFAISEQQYLDLSQSAKEKGATDLLRGGSKIPLELTLANGSKYPLAGSIVFVDRGVDNTTGTIMIAGSFANPQNLLRPGQFAKVRALTRIERNALLVPQRAVLDQQGQHVVVVVGADNKAEMRKVEVGSQVGQSWIVTNGLVAGEHVITEGNSKVRDGVVVQPVADTQSAGEGH